LVQEDPIGYGGGSNLYAYVEGQALEATDPSGTIKCEVVRYCGGGSSGSRGIDAPVPGFGGGCLKRRRQDHHYVATNRNGWRYRP